MHTLLKPFLISAALALPAASTQAQTATFNFDDLPLGTQTAFDQTHNGIDTFFVSIGNNPFAVGGAGTTPLFSGHTLGVGGGNNGLELGFSVPIYSLSVNFGAYGLSSSPDSVNITSFGLAGPSGPGGPFDTEVGTVYASVPLGAATEDFVDGTLTLTSTTPIGGVFITDNNATGFSLDNLTVNASPVPEASTTISFGLLMTLGLGGAALRSRRHAAKTA